MIDHASEFDRFEQAARDSAELLALAEKIADDAAQHVDLAPTRTLGPIAAGLTGLVFYALFRMAKSGCDYLDGLSDTALVEKRVQVVRDLTDAGFPSNQSAAVVDAAFKDRIQRTQGDSVVKLVGQIVDTNA